MLIHPQSLNDLDAIIKIAENLKKKIELYEKDRKNVDWVCHVTETFEVIEGIARDAFMREAV
jgi:hypothetical protein